VNVAPRFVKEGEIEQDVVEVEAEVQEVIPVD
jgi:hypothetical protein